SGLDGGSHVTSALLQQLGALRKEGQFCDCTIVVGSTSHPAHKVALAASSLLFRSLLAGSDSISIDTAVVTPPEFSCLLDMVYTGRLPPGQHNLTRMIAAADSLQMFDVAVGCKNVLTSLMGPSDAALAEAEGQKDATAAEVVGQEACAGSAESVEKSGSGFEGDSGLLSRGAARLFPATVDPREGPWGRLSPHAPLTAGSAPRSGAARAAATSSPRRDRCSSTPLEPTTAPRARGRNRVPSRVTSAAKPSPIRQVRSGGPSLVASSPAADDVDGFCLPSGMQYHKRTEHFEEKPYPCTECGAKFAAKSSLKNHARLHTGEKPFRCKHCDMSFSVAAALSYHTKKKHSEGTDASTPRPVRPRKTVVGTTLACEPEERKVPGSNPTSYHLHLRHYQTPSSRETYNQYLQGQSPPWRHSGLSVLLRDTMVVSGI
uniref:Uncharacterized protein n=1 Tax=Denticeps clupeoides TaxID=299321 RepID=A0AAY4CX68_9TELE